MALAVAAYRFGVNLGAQSTHPWYAALNTAINFGDAKTGTFLLRMLVQATGAGQNNVDFQLRYKLNAGAFTNVTTTSSVVRAVTTTVFTDTANTTSRLGGTGTFESSSNGCSHDGLCGGNNFDIVADGNGECLFSLQLQIADISPGDTITFDLLVDGATFTQSVTPTINVVAGPVEVIRTLDTAGGADYTTQALWESTEQQDWEAQDEISVLECRTGTTSESFFVGGSVTTAAHYREIRAAPGHEHDGDFTAGFIAASSSSNAGAIKPFDDHLRINGIVMRAGSQTSNPLISVGGGTTVPELWVGNCLIDGEGAGLNHGINRTTTAGTDRYWNNAIRGFSAVCINCNQVDSTFYVYNNTLIGGTHGVQRFNGTVHVKNNIAQGQSTACYAGTFSSSVTNLSSDATGEIQATLDFVNAAGKDYHLAAGDTEAIGAGTDLSADAGLAFDIDFEGDSRPAGDWDIGADQSDAPSAPSGAAACTLQPLTAAAAGELVYVASAAAAMQPLAASAQGAFEVSGAAVAAVQHLIAAAAGAQAQNPEGAAAAALQHLAAAASGAESFDGAAAAALQPLIAAANGLESFDGSAAGALQHLLANAVGAMEVSGAAAAELQSLIARAFGQHGDEVVRRAAQVSLVQRLSMNRLSWRN